MVKIDNKMMKIGTKEKSVRIISFSNKGKGKGGVQARNGLKFVQMEEGLFISFPDNENFTKEKSKRDCKVVTRKEITALFDGDYEMSVSEVPYIKVKQMQNQVRYAPSSVKPKLQNGNQSVAGVVATFRPQGGKTSCKDCEMLCLEEKRSSKDGPLIVKTNFSASSSRQKVQKAEVESDAKMACKAFPRCIKTDAQLKAYLKKCLVSAPNLIGMPADEIGSKAQMQRQYEILMRNGYRNKITDLMNRQDSAADMEELETTDSSNKSVLDVKATNKSNSSVVALKVAKDTTGPGSSLLRRPTTSLIRHILPASSTLKTRPSTDSSKSNLKASKSNGFVGNRLKFHLAAYDVSDSDLTSNNEIRSDLSTTGKSNLLVSNDIRNNLSTAGKSNLLLNNDIRSNLFTTGKSNLLLSSDIRNNLSASGKSDLLSSNDFRSDSPASSEFLSDPSPDSPPEINVPSDHAVRRCLFPSGAPESDLPSTSGIRRNLFSSNPTPSSGLKKNLPSNIGAKKDLPSSGVFKSNLFPNGVIRRNFPGNVFFRSTLPGRGVLARNIPGSNIFRYTIPEGTVLKGMLSEKSSAENLEIKIESMKQRNAKYWKKIRSLQRQLRNKDKQIAFLTKSLYGLKDGVIVKVVEDSDTDD